MGEVEDTVSIAVLAEKMDNLKTAVEDVKKKLETSTTVHVTRSEWELRNQTVDERFVVAKADREAIWTELKMRRAPWWAVVSAVSGSVAVIGLALQWIPAIVNK